MSSLTRRRAALEAAAKKKDMRLLKQVKFNVQKTIEAYERGVDGIILFFPSDIASRGIKLTRRALKYRGIIFSSLNKEYNGALCEVRFEAQFGESL